MTKSTKKAPAKSSKAKPAAKKAHVTKSGKKAKSNAGRPTKFTPDTLAKLDSAFMCGATHGEAAIFAGIHPCTLSKWLAENPEYAQRIAHLQNQPRLLAKALVVAELQKGNLSVAWEVLERGRVDGYAKPQEPGRPGVQVNIATPPAPAETPEGMKALEVLSAIFSGRALPGPEHQGEG